MEFSYRLCVISGFHHKADEHCWLHNNLEEHRPQLQAVVITVMNIMSP